MQASTLFLDRVRGILVFVLLWLVVVLLLHGSTPTASQAKTQLGSEKSARDTSSSLDRLSSSSVRCSYMKLDLDISECNRHNWVVSHELLNSSWTGGRSVYVALTSLTSLPWYLQLVGRQAQQYNLLVPVILDDFDLSSHPQHELGSEWCEAVQRLRDNALQLLRSTGRYDKLSAAGTSIRVHFFPSTEQRERERSHGYDTQFVSWVSCVLERRASVSLLVSQGEALEPMVVNGNPDMANTPLMCVWEQTASHALLQAASMVPAIGHGDSSIQFIADQLQEASRLSTFLHRCDQHSVFTQEMRRFLIDTLHVDRSMVRNLQHRVGVHCSRTEMTRGELRSQLGIEPWETVLGLLGPWHEFDVSITLLRLLGPLMDKHPHGLHIVCAGNGKWIQMIRQMADVYPHMHVLPNHRISRSELISGMDIFLNLTRGSYSFDDVLLRQTLQRYGVRNLDLGVRARLADAPTLHAHLDAIIQQTLDHASMSTVRGQKPVCQVRDVGEGIAW